MQYDPVAFRQMQQGRQTRVQREYVRGSYVSWAEIEKIDDPLKMLAAATIAQAVLDLRRARMVTRRAGMMSSDKLRECRKYFASNEYENHCALIGADPASVRRGIGLEWMNAFG